MSGVARAARAAFLGALLLGAGVARSGTAAETTSVYRAGLGRALTLAAADLGLNGGGCVHANLLPAEPRGGSFQSSSKLAELAGLDPVRTGGLVQHPWPGPVVHQMLKANTILGSLRVVKRDDAQCAFTLALETPYGTAAQFIVRIVESDRGGSGRRSVAYMFGRGEGETLRIIAKTSVSIVVV